MNRWAAILGCTLAFALVALLGNQALADGIPRKVYSQPSALFRQDCGCRRQHGRVHVIRNVATTGFYERAPASGRPIAVSRTWLAPNLSTLHLLAGCSPRLGAEGTLQASSALHAPQRNCLIDA
jgi:hypothetical protein